MSDARRQRERMRLNTIMWPDATWTMFRDEWLLAERFGIDAGWIYDHLDLGERPVWHEALTALAGVAVSTSAIGLGTMVTSPNFRHPAVVAKAAVTLADMSSGRFTLGVGAGGPGVDSDAFGGRPLTRADRMERFGEFVALTRDLLTQPRVHREGSFFTVDQLGLGGGGLNDLPPIAIAATGRRGMAVAAAHADTWITQDIVPQQARKATPASGARTGYSEIRHQLELLDDVCDRQGREPASLPRLAVLGYGDERPLDSLEAFRDCVGRYSELGVSTIAVLWPRGENAHRRLKVLEAAAAELA
jgi:alkanesulfonate monooxygenase SsuD/methylene tetrahydromethanopterin reductase-like flavin-dependent oxidoreductase (luciferase family)